MMIFHRHLRKNADIIRNYVSKIMKICSKKYAQNESIMCSVTSDGRRFRVFLCKNGSKIKKIVLIGAKEFKSCSSRKMLKNDALIAEFGVDTAEL